MCRVLGGLLEEGVVVKIADDLYCGGDTPKLLHNCEKVLLVLAKYALTIICPKAATILGCT